MFGDYAKTLPPPEKEPALRKARAARTDRKLRSRRS